MSEPLADISDAQTAAALLRWYADMGVDEAVSATPADFTSWGPAAPVEKAHPAPSQQPAQSQQPARSQSAPRPQTAAFEADASILAADEAAALAKSIAAKCLTHQALAEAVAAFEGCPLKASARKTVFADGVPGADLLVLGEAPGRDEDSIGRPFVGRAGQLLDRMLAAIDRSREKDVLISNVIYWRPPGNRTPTQIEVATCRPFVDRLIELTAPKVILLAGGAPLQALLGITGIMRARGVWREIVTADGTRIAVLPMFHPAFLLRQPANKRLAWHDLQSLDARLRDG